MSIKPVPDSPLSSWWPLFSEAVDRRLEGLGRGGEAVQVSPQFEPLAARDKQIIEAHQLGVSRVQIAREHNISPSRVGQIIDRWWNMGRPIL